MTQPKRRMNYDIGSCDELKSEIRSYQNNEGGYPEDLDWERYAIGRSVDLGCTEAIPDDWMMVDDE